MFPKQLSARAQSYGVMALVLLQFVALMLVVAWSYPLTFGWHNLDLTIYFTDSLHVRQHQIPYRDFALEYPPLALLAFIGPRIAVFGRALDLGSYIWLFLLQNAIFSTLVALVLVAIAPLWQPRRTALVLSLYALLVAITAPLLPWRYDLFPALLTAFALLCVFWQRPGWAGIWLGLGVAAKLYPVVLLPVFGAYYLASRDRRALVWLALGSAGALALAFGPFLAVAADNLLSFLRYHQQRGLQVESVSAGVIILAHALGMTRVTLAFNYGALHLVSPLATVALGWLPLVFVLVFGVVAASALLRFWQEYVAQGRIAPATLLGYVLAGLLAFIVTNKVFSPQYVIWLLPFVPLLRARQAGVFAMICVITIFLFPFDYNNLLALQLLPVVLLNLRNLLVVALLCWLLRDYAPALRWPLVASRAAPQHEAG